MAFKFGLKTLKEVYKLFSGKFANPGAPKFMSTVEFTEMINEMYIYSDYFTAN